MKSKKVFAALLALAMTASLASCGQGGNSSTADGGSAAAGGETTGSSQTEFDITIVRWAESWGTTYSESAFLKEIAEQTGVTINWQTYYNADWSEQKSLLLASGDLPDAFFGSITLTDTDVSQNKASFYELTDLISANMPNLTAIMAEDPTIKALCTDPNGEIYSLPKKLPLRPTTANEMYINMDFVDTLLGGTVPDTYEQLADYLIAVGQQDPDGNGQNDTYGYINAASLSGDLNNILIPFGIQASRVGNYMSLDKDGNPYFVPTSETYKEAVKWMKNLYDNGGVDPERFTQDSSMVNAKIQAEGGSKTGLISSWSADAETGANVGQFKVLKAVTGPDGNRYCESDPTFLNYNRNEMVITKTCENPDLLLQWADCFYTDLASLQTYYGSIGDGKIADNGDGTYELLLPEDGTSLDTSCWTYSFRDHGPKYMSAEFEANVVLPTDQGDGAKLLDDEVNREYACNTFPVCYYTDEQLSNLTMLTTDIYNYVEAQYAHWVVEGGIDEEWDAYLQQLEAMQLSQVVAIQTEAYEAYKNA